MQAASISPANVLPPTTLEPTGACLTHYFHIAAVLLLFNSLNLVFQLIFVAVAGCSR
jgi:hypothetical protein